MAVNSILEIIFNKKGMVTNKPFLSDLLRLFSRIRSRFKISRFCRGNKIHLVNKDKRVHIKRIIVIQVQTSVFFMFIFFMFVDHVTVHGSDAECSKEFSKASGSKTPASLISFYTGGPQEGTNRRSNSQQ